MHVGVCIYLLVAHFHLHVCIYIHTYYIYIYVYLCILYEEVPLCIITTLITTLSGLQGFGHAGLQGFRGPAAPLQL